VCFFIKFKGEIPGLIEKKFGRAVFISALQYSKFDILLYSVTTRVIRMLVVSKEM